MFQRYFPLLQTYRNKAVLRTIVSDIEEQLRIARKMQLMQLLTEIKEPDAVRFLRIHLEDCPDIRNYLMNKLILHVLPHFVI